MAFGLGAGACFYYVTMDGQSPSRFTNGRVARLEEQFVELARRASSCGPSPMPGLVGGGARGRRRRPPRNPAHRPLLPRPLRQLRPLPRPCGRARRLRRRASPTSPTRRSTSCRRPASRACGQARHGEHPIFPLRGPPARAAGGQPRSATCAAAIDAAVERNARQMLEPALGDYEGLPALRRFAAEVGRLAGRARRLAVVRALRLPGDRAPGNGRRQLPADVLAVPGRGRQPARRAGRRGCRRLDRSGRRRCSPAASRPTPSPELWSAIAIAPAPSWTSRSACGRRWPDLLDEPGEVAEGRARALLEAKAGGRAAALAERRRR